LRGTFARHITIKATGNISSVSKTDEPAVCICGCDVPRVDILDTEDKIGLQGDHIHRIFDRIDEFSLLDTETLGGHQIHVYLHFISFNRQIKGMSNQAPV
jgi:hypothetical protein